MYEFRLYIAGKTRRALKAIEDLKKLLEDCLKGEYTLQIVDILKTPQRAHEDKVFATPTVVRISPSPSRRIIGNLNVREKILAVLMNGGGKKDSGK